MAVEFKDYYKILGVDKSADEKAIRTAYRRLARKYHPDVNKSPEAPERFKEISEAYEVLSDPEKRRRYDSLGPDWQRYAHPGAGPDMGGFRVEYGGAEDFSEFFRQVFGDLGIRMGRPGRAGRGGFDVDIEDLLGGGPRRRGRPERGSDVQVDVEVTLEEAFHGTRRALAFDLDEPCAACGGAGNVGGRSCPTCGGTGWQRSRRQVEVRIPAGVRSGQRVRVRGEGAGAPGRRGDLYLAVTVAPHPLYRREGDDVLIELPVTAPEAALGASVEVPTLKGKVAMKIPPGTSSGRKFRIPGYGMPKPGGGSGDQYVTIKIVMPADPTPAERELYEKLKALRSDNPRAYIG